MNQEIENYWERLAEELLINEQLGGYQFRLFESQSSDLLEELNPLWALRDIFECYERAKRQDYANDVLPEELTVVDIPL
jgi:hypothetical protein